MGRYLGPKHKLCRRVGEKICGLDKCPVIRRPYPAGVHGPTSRRRLTGFGIQLLEKQKAKMIYGLLEKQFRKYVNVASRSKGNTSEKLLELLERRLDNVIFRLGFARTRGQARQYVGHGHFTVNSRKTTIRSYSVRVGDLIGIRNQSSKKKIFDEVKEKLSKQELPPWLSVDLETLTAKVIALPTGTDARPLFDPKLIVEFYSR